MKFVSLSVASTNEDIYMLYIAAAVIGAVGLLFALNFYQMAERFHRLVTTFVPAGRSTPRTMRFVGAGWVVVATLMVLPEILQVFR
ncbi:hypothetical protein GCM10010271_72760 [Streptomyces kurssanovii]|nr:hypothetical protein GCM10010271_72760 [Streptomyces kurssanovii]